MSAITYKANPNNTIVTVYLAGRRVGSIMRTIDGKFRYWPKGSDVGGDKFDTLKACKDSLEAA